jgi:hypothetical protein
MRGHDTRKGSPEGLAAQDSNREMAAKCATFLQLASINCAEIQLYWPPKDVQTARGDRETSRFGAVLG